MQQARGGGGSASGGSSGSGRGHQSQSNITKIFNKYDVPETSYHFYSERIDLHFCDDPGREFLLSLCCFCLFDYLFFFHSLCFVIVFMVDFLFCFFVFSFLIPIPSSSSVFFLFLSWFSSSFGFFHHFYHKQEMAREKKEFEVGFFAGLSSYFLIRSKLE